MLGIGRTGPDPSMSHKTEDNIEIPMGTGINQPDGTRSSLLYNEYPFYLYQVSRFVCLFLSLPNNVWRLIVFAPFFLIIFIYYYYYYYSPFFLWHMNLSMADLRNYWTEFHETWWSYRYMFLVGPKVFSFVVKGVKVIF